MNNFNREVIRNFSYINRIQIGGLIKELKIEYNKKNRIKI